MKNNRYICSELYDCLLGYVMFEILVDFHWITRCHIPEDRNLLDFHLILCHRFLKAPESKLLLYAYMLLMCLLKMCTFNAFQNFYEE